MKLFPFFFLCVECLFSLCEIVNSGLNFSILKYMFGHDLTMQYVNDEILEFYLDEVCGTVKIVFIFFLSI